MRRIAALLKKELWHHGALVFALVVLLFAVSLLLLLGGLVAPRTITLLETHATFVRFFIPLVGLALGNRLVVEEYQAGTQRFLEALPIRRVEVVLTKLAAGLAVLSFAALGSLAVSALAALVREPITLPWIALVALKTELFVLALFSVLFTLGLFGRWRIPVYLALFFLVLFLSSATDVELTRFGPIALVGERFVLEREEVPWGDVLATLALATGTLVVGLGAALAREGSLAEALARRMSAREKVAVGAVLVFGLMAGEIADAHRAKEPFSFEGESVLRRTSPEVSVLYLEPRHRAIAEALSSSIAGDLTSLRDALGLASLPPVHVALREALDPRTIEVERDDEHAVRLGASFAASGFDRDDLRAALLSRVLEVATDGRAAFEPYAWARTGIARAWVHREERSPALRPMLRALVLARSRRPSIAMLERWQETEERFGPAASEGLAYAAVRAMEGRAGRRRTMGFARALFGAEPPWGIAAVIEARLDPPLARMERETGLDARALEQALRAEIASWRRDARARALALVPRAAGSIEAMRDGELRSLRWRVAFEGVPEEGASCALVHAAAGPFDQPLHVGELFREEVPCDALGPEGEALAGRYGPGERVLVAIEIDGATLGAPVRVASDRLEVP